MTMGFLSKLNVPSVSSVLRKIPLPTKKCPNRAQVNRPEIFRAYQPYLVSTRTIVNEPSTSTTAFKNPYPYPYNGEDFSSQVLPLMNTWAVPTPTNVLFKLAEFSRQSPAPISIQEFLARGEVGAIQEKESFNFLFKEMTIRY